MKKLDMKAFILILLLLIIVVMFYYVYIGNQSGNQTSSEEKSEVESLLEYDFEDDYPKTVRETVKLHNTYLKLAYNGTFCEEELDVVNKNIRQLMDEELLSYNLEQDQLEGMKTEIKEFEEDEKKFVNFAVADGSTVEESTENGRNYAKITVSLVIKVEGKSVYPEEEYILRKDENGRWKILGWQITTKSEE